MSQLNRIQWSNPARRSGEPIVADLCVGHTRSLVGTLQRLRLAAAGRAIPAHPAGCDQCRGRDRNPAA